jgi:hypothetical protein
MVDRRFLSYCLRLASVFAVLSTPLISYAEAGPALEYQIKAAFLYNFAKFVEWPANEASHPAHSIVIGVLGDDPFGGFLEQTLVGKTYHDKPLVARRVQKSEDPASFQVLFISKSEEARLGDILTSLDGASVLTVSDMDHFADRGGMIGFRREGNKVRFEINADAAARAGLTISSQLLKLATRVIYASEAGRS